MSVIDQPRPTAPMATPPRRPTQAPRKTGRLKSFLRLISRLVVYGCLVAGTGAGVYYVWQTQFAGIDDSIEALTAAARHGTLRVTVTERGNLESRNTVDGVCEVSGYDLKIISIVPEGTTVKEGDVVVQIDTEKIDKNIAEQEIKVNEAREKVETSEQELEVERNQGESDVAAAELELTLADLDLEKYKEGDLDIETNDISGQIALSAFEKEQAVEGLKHARALVKKGFREVEFLKQKEQDLRRAEFNLKRDEKKLSVLEQYDSVRKITEFDAKAVEAKKKLERAKKNAVAKVTKLENGLSSAKARVAMREKELDEYREQKERCEIKAKGDGVVAYFNERWWSSDRQIREGAMIHFRQKLFTLPDMTSMQVKVNVHESMIKKVKVDQKTKIRVDAYPKLLLVGTVTKVSPLADSTDSWRRGGVKAYTTLVVIDEMPDVDLKPGMTAEVEIEVNEIAKALVVPVQAVTEHDREHFVYVEAEDGFQRRTVEIGDSNERMVQIVEGLSSGEQVALDARARGIEEFDGKVPSTDEEPPAEPAPAAKTQPSLAAKG